MLKRLEYKIREQFKRLRVYINHYYQSKLSGISIENNGTFAN